MEWNELRISANSGGIFAVVRDHPMRDSLGIGNLSRFSAILNVTRNLADSPVMKAWLKNNLPSSHPLSAHTPGNVHRTFCESLT